MAENFMQIMIVNCLFMLLTEKTMKIIFVRQRTSVFFMWTSFLSATLVMSTLSFFLSQDIQGANVYLNALLLPAVLLLQFLLTFNYNSSLIRRLTTLGVVIALDATSAFLNTAMNLFLPASLNISITYILAATCSTMILYSLLTAISTKFTSIRKNTFDSKKLLFLIIAPILAFFIFLLYVIENASTLDLTVATALLIFIIIFAFMYLIFTYYNNASETQVIKLQAKIHEQEKDYYLSQCEMMQSTVEQIKAIRHDMKLHLATLEDHILKSPTDAIKYLQTLTGDIERTQIYSETGNLALDSIINFKLQEMATLGIKSTLHIFTPPVLGIEAPDIVIIIGNLLDNAIEAAEKVEEKFINVNITYQLGNLFIKIENSFDGVVAHKKNGSELATRKKSDNHGYGLQNIQSCADKYNGIVDVSYTEDTFSVEVLLYNKE